MAKKIAILALTFLLAIHTLPGLTKAEERFDFLIITTRALVESVKVLSKHRSEQGHIVKVLSIDDVTNPNSVPKDSQLWDYLDANYQEWGLEYLLIVGNVFDIPQAKLHAANGVTTTRVTEPGVVYSDIYYSILGQDWDANKNGYKGEPIDAVEINPKIAVGRIPFSDKKIVESIISSIVGYDSRQNLKSILQIGANYLFDKENGDPTNIYTDGAMMHERIWTDLLSVNLFSRTSIFEDDGLGIKHQPKTDRKLTTENILREMESDKYGIVNVLAHGTEDTLIRKRWIQDKNGNGWADKKLPDGSSEIREETLLSPEIISSRKLDNNIIIATACSTARISTQLDTIATASLRSGAACYIGGTAMNYFIPGWQSSQDGGNQTITYDIIRHYVDGKTLGWSLMNTLRDYANVFARFGDKTLQNVYSFTLLGDPTMIINPPKAKNRIPVFLTPNSLNITAGQGDVVEIEITKVDSLENLALTVTPSVNGLTFKPDKSTIRPGDRVKLEIKVALTVKTGDYDFQVMLQSKNYQGEASLHIKVVPPPESTVIALAPEYTLAQVGNEFWLDLVVQPTKPIDRLAGLLEYDTSSFEFVGYRIGDLFYQDYRCPADISVIDNKSEKSLAFSCIRNIPQFGVTKIGIAFSFCFRGIKETKQSQKFALTSINIESNQADGSRTHSFVSLPYSLVNIKPVQAGQSSGYKLTTNLDLKLNDSLNADVYTSVGGIRLTGTATVGTDLTINGVPVAMDSEGKYTFDLSLYDLVTDVTITLRDSYNISLMLKRKIWLSLVKELGFHRGEDEIWIDGNCFMNDVAPYIKNSRTLVPLRLIAEELGFTVNWIASKKQIDMVNGATKIQMTIGNNTAYVNGKSVTLDVSPEITGSRTFVPLRFVSEELGCEVSWFQDTSTALVVYRSNGTP